MKSKEELKKYLLENFIDEDGDLDLSNLDFSDFDGNVYICDMKVKKDLIQNYQIVNGDLIQSDQKVGGNLYQGFQQFGGNLYQR